jgi:hypothetical protein
MSASLWLFSKPTGHEIFSATGDNQLLRRRNHCDQHDSILCAGCGVDPEEFARRDFSFRYGKAENDKKELEPRKVLKTNQGNRR